MIRQFLLSAVFGVILLIQSGAVYAHALQPGYLEMRLVGPDQYAVLWKVPAVGSHPMEIFALLPKVCSPRHQQELRWDGSAYVSRWMTSCPGGLAGEILRIDGLEQTATDVLARIETGKESFESIRLTPSEPEAQLMGHPSLGQVANSYFRLGVKHILGGVDHLLFVAALMLLVSGWRQLVSTITAFTVAHSITLAASTLGVISVPVPPIEALISLSIAFVASEVVHLRQGQHSLTSSHPSLIAFTFGLLHGVGFASALTSIGLPQTFVPAALLFFNFGVEAGQLLFVFCILGTVALIRQIAWMRDRVLTGPVVMLVPYVIGTLACFWVLERISVF